jgi:orotate phosphoribosyltransferase
MAATAKVAGRGEPASVSKTELAAAVRARGYERREQAFRLSSGGESHDYVDLRRAVCQGEDLERAARAVLQALEEAGIDFDVIGGMTMGADPVSHATALLSNKSWYSVRKAPKDHGTARRTEGALLSPGVRAVVFEDTVSTGRSLLEALEVVEATGASVVALVTILDRGEALCRELASRPDPPAYLRLLTYEDLGIEAL